MGSQIGETELRKEVVDGVIKGRANAMYKFKRAVSISTTSAWKNTYFRESSAALTGQTGNAILGIPRGANFPQAVVDWEEHSKWIEKYGLEDNIYWEDILTDDVDVQARTLFRIAEGVAKAVDDEIWAVLSEDQSESEIQAIDLQVTNEAGRYWDVASAAIIDDLMKAAQLIEQYNYSTAKLMCFISPRDRRSIMKYLTDSGAQFPDISTTVAKNGSIGRLAGVELVVSNSVTASYALVVVPKVCGTWKSAVPLSTDVTVDPFRSVRIRAVEEGATLLTDPKACVLIKGTQSKNA